jgi:hypothetical protein
VAVLDRLLDLGDRVLLVRGNADRELVALAQGKESTVGEPLRDRLMGGTATVSRARRAAGRSLTSRDPGRRGLRPGGVLPRHTTR